MKKIKVKQLMLFANGNIAAFDSKGKQIFDIQRRTWLEVISRFFGLDKYDFKDAKTLLQGKYE